MAIRISESLIKDHLICPKRTYYRINFPSESIQTNEMAIGSVVHAVLEKAWHTSKEAIDEIEVQLKRFNVKSNVDLVYRCVSNFFTLYQPMLTEDDIIEKFFSVPYGKDVTLVGRMDRIIGERLIDWKTGASEPEDIERDVQCLFYSLAYRKLFNKAPKEISLIFLAKGKEIKYTPNDILINEFEKQVLPNVISEVKSGKFPRNGLFMYRGCNRCPYQNICYRELRLE